MVNDDLEFTFDDSDDLEKAILQQVNQAVKKDDNSDDSAQQQDDQSQKRDNNDRQAAAAGDGSVQQTLDNGEGIEQFFDNISRKTGDDQDDQDDDTDDQDDDQDDQDDQQDQSQGDEGDGDEGDEGEGDDSDDDSNQTSDLLDIIKQEGLLYIPDDFSGDLDESTLDYFKEQTKAIQERELVDTMRSRVANDPLKAELLEYFLIGDPQADISSFMNIQNQGVDYANLDVKNETIQRQLIKDYLREGLNPDIPSHKDRLDNVEAELGSIMENMKGEGKAVEARDYFVEKMEAYKDEEFKMAQYRAQQRQMQEDNRKLNARTWHDNFQNTVQSSEWSSDRKRAILAEQYDTVEMGQKVVPVWYAKESMIKRDPQLYQVYLDWLNNNFDLNTGSFKDDTLSSENRTTRKIMNIIKKKGGSKNKSHQQRSRRRVKARKVSEADLQY